MDQLQESARIPGTNQALGLPPYGEIGVQKETVQLLNVHNVGRHQSKLVRTKVLNKVTLA